MLQNKSSYFPFLSVLIKPEKEPRKRHSLEGAGYSGIKIVHIYCSGKARCFEMSNGLFLKILLKAAIELVH